jgi:hypothetical protein
MTDQGRSHREGGAVSEDLLSNRFEGFSGVCDIVDDGDSPSLDEV